MELSTPLALAVLAPAKRWRIHASLAGPGGPARYDVASFQAVRAAATTTVLDEALCGEWVV